MLAPPCSELVPMSEDEAAGTALPLAEGVGAGAGGAAGGGEGTGLTQTTPRSHARWCGASCHSRTAGTALPLAEGVAAGAGGATGGGEGKPWAVTV